MNRATNLYKIFINPKTLRDFREAIASIKEECKDKKRLSSLEKIICNFKERV